MNKKKILFSALFFPAAIWAQSTAQITGTVTGSDKKPVPYLKVILNNGDAEATTDENGVYRFNNIPAGKYVLKVDDPEITKTYSFTLTENDRVTYNFVQNSSAYQIQTVNVVANRKTIPSSTLRLGENLLVTPQNIQVIDQRLLNDQQIFTTAEGLSRNVSGVRTITHQEEGSVGIAVRGFSASNLRNGMDVSGSFGPLREDMSFVERVEFVKGPAGFMMGNTQPGGFYNIVTKKPTGREKGNVQLTLGSFNLYRATADVEKKLSKDGKFWGRLNLMGSKNGSFQQYTEHEQYVINPSFKYLVSDKTNVTFEYILSQNNFQGGFAKYAYGIDGFKDVKRSFTFSDPIVDPTRAWEHNLYGTINHNFNDNWLITGQFGYVRSQMQGESLYAKYNSITLADDPKTGRKKGDVDRGISINDALNTSTIGQIFTRGKFATGNINHNLLAGIDMGKKFYVADWTALSQNVGPTFNIYNPVYGNLKKSDIPVYDRSQSLRERGANYLTDYSYTSFHIQDEARFIDDKLRIAAGFRYTSTVKTSSADKGNEVKNHAVTPRFSVTGLLTPTFTVYALYDESFQEQAGKLINGSSADPSYGKNKEIGLKKTWFNGQLMTNLTFYHLSKTNMLTPAGIDRPGLFEQSGESVSKGIEFDLNGNISKNWSILFNYAYTDAKVTKDKDPNKIGGMLYGTAKHITNAWIKYTIAEGDLEGLGFSAGYEYQAKRAAWPVAGSPYLPDDYFTLDLGVSYKKDNYQISFLVNNLTDRYNYVGFYPGAWGYSHYGWRTLNPINFRLNLSYSF
ncbi:TonB-dependent receptor [Elizabethkingia meningoseptica]|uniref:TonB-dependent receptor n=1 Tax=Elizabethkingia meningoseptica TaxID=238 RepID=UPI000332BD93|nr:TonB-dependent receptor [Elizabethkingia meningoseptica]AQX06161.1 TonB-dependent receptor [Elizabethkingia meningoseptica]AQX48207.1 TonB-dependent receptor [Elizabethkingia meningoseptica]EOR29452.1 TonB-dependent siderophore receptor [Elizabethkingia meningoseptica ATCC 13253 = NBRC 12535]KUY23393.1 TonB-dependent receptor [Elizabethkingia meningoseptica]OPB71542.1 TonB-dependent receptor [Elizabethkingia meningoseptica]